MFASIAAVIAVGATYGQRSERAIELIGGVVLGIGVADLLVRAIGTGPAQIGLMVLLAMSAAVILGGGPLLVTEAAVSAILLVVLEPTSAGLAGSRVIQALVGGGVALAVSALAFPPDPVLLVRRSAQGIFSSLGRTLEELAAALAGRDTARAEAALRVGARDRRRRPCARRGAGARARDRALLARAALLARGAGSLRARRPARRLRRAQHARARAPRGCASCATTEPRRRSWPRRCASSAWPCGRWRPSSTIRRRGAPAGARHASRAAARAVGSFESDRDLGLAEIVAQVRSTAIDLVRAAEAGGSPPSRGGDAHRGAAVELPAPA